MMEKVVDWIMTSLFEMAEYVCGRCSFLVDEPATPQEVAPTIRFSNEDKMVEGELFKEKIMDSYDKRTSQTFLHR